MQIRILRFGIGNVVSYSHTRVNICIQTRRDMNFLVFCFSKFLKIRPTETIYDRVHPYSGRRPHNDEIITSARTYLQ